MILDDDVVWGMLVLALLSHRPRVLGQLRERAEPAVMRWRWSSARSTIFIHPMHIRGGPFTIVQKNGNPVPVTAQIQKDTVNIDPGTHYDVSGKPDGPTTVTSQATPPMTMSRSRRR